MTLAAPPVGDGPIWTVWMALFHAPTLAIADELGVFRTLADSPSSARELAETLALEPRATEAMCGVLTSLELLQRDGERFAVTETARTYLLPESPYYWGGVLRRIRTIPVDCTKLIASLRAGAATNLTEMWQASLPPPEALVGFTHAMHAHSFALAMRVVARFGIAGSLLDVAGGSGSYSIAAALHDPDAACTVLELPAVCPVAEAYAAKHLARVATVPANMFVDEWPGEFDALLLADVIHDWDDERCAFLVRRALAAVRPGGRLLVHEMLLDDDKLGPPIAVAYSMLMVYVTQGRQRTSSELRALLVGAGFVDIRITPTENGYSLVEGTRA